MITLNVSLQDKVETQRQRFRLEFEKYRGFLGQEEQLQLRQLEQEERATLQRLCSCHRQLVQHSQVLSKLAQELNDRCGRPAMDLMEVRPPQLLRLQLHGKDTFDLSGAASVSGNPTESCNSSH